MNAETIMQELSKPGAYTGLTQYMYDARKEAPEVSAALRSGQSPTIVFSSADNPAAAPESLPAAPFPATVVPDEEKRGRGRPPKIPLSPDALRDELDRIGIKVRWNVITRRLDYEGVPEAWDLDPETISEQFQVQLEYELKPLYSGTRDIKRLITLIGKAKSNCYNVE